MYDVIAFVPQFNTGRKRDATGAFQPEAKAFVSRNGGRIIMVDNRQTDEHMRKQVLKGLSVATLRTSVVAFFCHGQSSKIQFGFNLKNVGELAQAINHVGHPNPIVPLYACSTAHGRVGPAVGGDGGFADALRDALCSHGSVDCVVDAHTTAGHTTCNPYVRRFEGRGSPVGGIGGSYIVQPGSKLWPKWRLALRETDLRFRFPLMTIGEIHATLIKFDPSSLKR